MLEQPSKYRLGSCHTIEGIENARVTIESVWIPESGIVPLSEQGGSLVVEEVKGGYGLYLVFDDETDELAFRLRYPDRMIKENIYFLSSYYPLDEYGYRMNGSKEIIAHMPYWLVKKTGGI